MKRKPTTTLNSDKVKHVKISAGYCMVVDTLGLLLYRSVETSQLSDCNIVGVGIKLKFFNKIGPSNLWTEGGARKNWYNDEHYKGFNL